MPTTNTYVLTTQWLVGQYGKTDNQLIFSQILLLKITLPSKFLKDRKLRIKQVKKKENS
jgi:hypothetical protein